MAVPKYDILSSLDALKLLLDTEINLRKAANMEWNNGNQNGMMLAAHNAIIFQIIEAAKELVAKS